MLSGLFPADPSTLTPTLFLVLPCLKMMPSPLNKRSSRVCISLNRNDLSSLSAQALSTSSPLRVKLTYYDKLRSRPRQQQITKPLPIRTTALLGTPSKTVLSGTPELVRGLRQFYLATDSGCRHSSTNAPLCFSEDLFYWGNFLES